MNKKTQLLTTILLTVLILSSAYAVIAPNTNAEITTNTAVAQGLTVINQVAGVDLAKYNATLTLDATGSYLDVLPTENVRYTLSGKGSRIDMLDTFVNGSLLMIDVLENSGSPNMTTPAANVVGEAKDFLLNYQSYSANSFYSQLASTLDQADATKNSTTTSGNVMFNITVTSGNSNTLRNSITFTWSYTSNGINAPFKCVSLSYENGFLKVFIDTWNLYPVGSNTVNLSEQQADNIAMKYAKTYSWTVGSGNETHVINNFNVTKPMVKYLVFCEAGNVSNARNSYSLTLYPMWRIGVGLDKYYPGNVYGIYVDVWADTGQVRDVQEVFSTLPPPASEVATIAESSINTRTSADIAQLNSFPAAWIILTACAILAMGAIPVWLRTKKKPLYSLSSPKLRKVGGAVLCFLIGSVILVALVSAMPTVNASSYAGAWADTADGSSGYDYHTSTEIYNQGMICEAIADWYSTYGYDADNWWGFTYQSAFLSTIDSKDQDNSISSVSTVFFDHGVGATPLPSPYNDEWHYMLCDSTGISSGNIYDYQIFDSTSTVKNYFNYISACMSASLAIPNGYSGNYGANQGGSGNPIGMPYAWTHEYTTSNPPAGYMSLNGYTNPDSGAYCYIGFPTGSASLSQTLAYWWPSTTYYDFVYNFFYYALVGQLTVNQALDAASYICWTPNYFGSCPLMGFTAIWPLNTNPPSNSIQSGCSMVVYGNGNIHLSPNDPHCVSPPSISSNIALAPTPGLIDTSYQFTASSNDPYGSHNLQYTFNWGDGSDDTVTGWTANNQPIQESHSWGSAGVYAVTVTAESDDGVWSNPSYYTINICQPVYYWLTMHAYDAYSGQLSPNVYVDGNYVGTAPLSIQVQGGYHTIGLDDPTWDPWWYSDVYLYSMTDQNYNFYYNGAYVPVFSDTIITSMYQ